MELCVAMKENNDRIVWCDTIEEAKETIAEFEAQDKANDEFDENTYCICDGHYHELEPEEIEALEGLTKEEIEKKHEDSRTPESINAFMKTYKFSMIEISNRFNIPYRTIQHWVSEGNDHRDCPEYVLGMMDEIMRRL